MTGLKLEPATLQDAPEIAALRTAVADQLTRTYGQGHWSYGVSVKGVLQTMRTAKIFVAHREDRLVATVSLGIKRPWAIDPSYFTAAKKPLYLTDMVVAPELQRQGIGRSCLEEVVRLARQWPADTIRLDAYDAPAGAGPFYARCGYQEVGRVVYRKIALVYYELVIQR